MIVKHYLEGSQNRKEIDDMGRGKILELPSDRIREAKAEAEKAKAEAKEAKARVRELEERLKQYGEDPALL